MSIITSYFYRLGIGGKSLPQFQWATSADDSYVTFVQLPNLATALEAHTHGTVHASGPEPPWGRISQYGRGARQFHSAAVATYGDVQVVGDTLNFQGLLAGSHTFALSTHSHANLVETLKRSVSIVTNTGGAGVPQAFLYRVPANTLATNSLLRLQMSGTMTGTFAPGTFPLTISYGYTPGTVNLAATILFTVPAPLAASTIPISWDLVVYVQCTGTTTNKIAYARLRVLTSTPPAEGTAAAINTVFQGALPFTADNKVDQPFAVTLVPGSSGTPVWKIRRTVLELL